MLRSTPKRAGVRLERHLTIGRPVIVEGMQRSVEDGDGGGVERGAWLGEKEGKRKEKEEVKRGGEEGVEKGKNIKVADVKVARLKKVLAVTEQQENSVLFKLPLEIRRKIYEEVLSGYVIHVYFVEAYRRMSHTRCKSHTPDVCGDMLCRRLFKVKGAKDAWGNVGLLSLLKSCRRM